MIGKLIDWLVLDEQTDLFEVILALGLNVLFLALTALLLWPLGRLRLALELTKGYGVLWGVTCIAVVVVGRIQHWLRVDLYQHANVYVISNLAVSCLLQVGWAAFAALAVRGFVVGTPIWSALLLYLAGALSCLIAFFVVSAFYQGHSYKFVSLPLALIGFLVVCTWPTLDRLWSQA